MEGRKVSWTEKEFNDLYNKTKNEQYYDINESTLKDYINNYNQKCAIPIKGTTVDWRVIFLVAIVISIILFLVIKRNKAKKKQKQNEK